VDLGAEGVTSKESMKLETEGFHHDKVNKQEILVGAIILKKGSQLTRA